MSLVFYTNPMSRGQIARWMLEEVGAPYEQHIVEYDVLQDDSAVMRDEGFSRVNPMRKVPAIVHEGKVVTETAAICAYLADAFPASGLGPRDGERADYYRWLFFAAGPLEAAISNHSVGWNPDPDKQRMFGYGTYDRVVDVLAAHLGGRDHVCGDRFTAADVYVGSHVIWGTQFGTLPARPEFEAYAARLTRRDAYRRAKTIDTDLIAARQGQQESKA